MGITTMVRGAVFGLALSAAPALAATTTFASFSPFQPVQNVRWEQVGTTGGNFYTTPTGTSNAAGPVFVNFSLLDAGSQVIKASFNFSASTTGDPAATYTIPGLPGTNFSQNVDSGTFSFTASNAFTSNGQNYAAGTNLLSGSFTNATLTGRLSSGSLFDSTVSGSGIVYNSGYFRLPSVVNTISRDFSIALTSANPGISALPGQSLGSFRASASGNFAINAVPEPAAWGMMILGFAAVGYAARHRRAGVRNVTA